MNGDLPPDEALLRDKSTRQQYYEQAAKFLQSHGNEHWACRYPGIVRELLRLWRYKEQKTVKFLKSAIEQQVSKCVNCAVALRTARAAALDAADAADALALESGGDGVSGALLREEVRAWDLARLTAAFEEASTASDIPGAQQSQGFLSSHVEVLLQPQLLLVANEHGRRLNDAFSASLATLLQGEFSITAAFRLPGLYLLCIHSDSAIRSWARVKVRSLGVLEHPAHFQEVQDVFDVLVNHCERLTMVRSGCKEGAEFEKLLPHALSNDEREVWMGVSAAIAQLSPWIVRDQVAPRYCGLVPLAYLSIVENSPCMLAAARSMQIFMRCLGNRFWQLTTCSFSPSALRRLLMHTATSPTAIVPVRQICLELLEEVALSAGESGAKVGTGGIDEEGNPSKGTADEIASFLSGRELRAGSAAHAAVSAMATRVLTRMMQRLLDRGLHKLPIVSSHLWAPHVVGTACSPNMPELSRMPAVRLVAQLVYLQTASIEAAHMRGAIGGQLSSISTSRIDKTACAQVDGQDGRLLVTDSAMWLESVWSWLLERAGTENIPDQVHAALLQSAQRLLVWPGPSDLEGTHLQRLYLTASQRFSTLILGYLRSLASMGGVVARLVHKEPHVEEVWFGLALIQQADVKQAVRDIVCRALHLGDDGSCSVGAALQALAVRKPPALVVGIRYGCDHCRQMGLDGAGFSTLHHLFLLCGQVVPLVLAPLPAHERHSLLQTVWDLLHAFVTSRTQLRKDSFAAKHGSVALDGTASAFFTCFSNIWPHFAVHVPDAADADAPSDDQDFDDRHHETLACAHSRWLPALAKWGGIASAVVRRHWCSCMVTVLGTLRRMGHTLTTKEKSVMDKLVARRDLWADDQYMALCNELRPLGAESVKGNVGLGALSDLPGMSSGQPVGGRPMASNAGTRNEKRGAGGRKKRQRKTSSHFRGSIDSLSECSEDDTTACRASDSKAVGEKKARKSEAGRTGVLGILADMGCTVRQQAGRDDAGDIMLAGGRKTVQVGAPPGKSVSLDVLGQRTRRQEASVQDLQDAFHAEILSWDLRRKNRQGAPCSEVPIVFESLDQYEDILGALLLEETWEQIVGAFAEEKSEVEDDTADFQALQVLSYNEMGDFAFSAVCPNASSRVGARNARSREEAGSGIWGSGLNEMDLVLLVSPDEFSNGHADHHGRRPDCQRKTESEGGLGARMEHALALIDKVQAGDAERGIVRLRLLSRKTLRNRRFSGRLARAAVRNGGVNAPENHEPDSARNSNHYFPQSEDGIRMVCLNYSVLTAEREFVAVHRLRTLEPAVQLSVLNPRRAATARASELALGTRRGSVSAVPQDSLNRDQMAAVAKCLEPGPLFSLIQGPPGTGKTSTLVGLLTALLAAPSGGEVQGGARVLVSAPSNAAVDELALRVSKGLVLQGCSRTYLPNVVRLGSKRQMRRDVWEAVALEHKVICRLAELEDEAKTAKCALGELRAEVSALTDRLEGNKHVEEGVARGDDMQALLAARKAALSRCAQQAALAGASQTRIGVLKRQLRSQFLDNAQIVFVTLSGVGADLMRGSTRTFDAVIVDEAAQALEPSTLIPLQLNIKRCILVGDPQQLPATITSRKADKQLYSRSLFERLQAAGVSAHLLSIQYRMHPCIRAFPSQHFYGNKLSDCLGESGRAASWHADIRFAPLVFYDMRGGEDEGPGGTSRSNGAEAEACTALLLSLQSFMPGTAGRLSKHVAIMSPYRRQCAEIRRRLAAAGLHDVEVSSVDAFQGREVDVAVLSCVRSRGSGLGFVADVRRLNVALTRARCSLLVIGDAATLSQNEHWAALVEHSRAVRMCVTLKQEELGQVFGDEDSGRWRTAEWPQEMLSNGP